MTRHSVREYASSVRRRYWTGDREAKRQILDEFCKTTGMHRKAAIRLLNRRQGPAEVKPARRGRGQRYGSEVVAALATCWEAGDRLCGKLLKPVLPDLVSALERHGVLHLEPSTKEQLLKMSASTMDRRLQRYRKPGLRQPQVQKPRATGLKAEVPIRTWSEWQDAAIGSVQADLVLHCGDSTEGFYLSTLCLIDVASGWTELQPVWGISQGEVLAALHQASRRLPFRLRELHTDNGSEFINYKFQAWCHREGVRSTRGRGYHKNDQAYVEQKNWQSVRRFVGYSRFASKEALQLLLQLYGYVRLQANFFRPVRKLIAKQRTGAKVAKYYDEPATPYQRLLASGDLSDSEHADLDALYLKLNPAALSEKIDELQRRLWRLGRQMTKVAVVG